VARLHDSSLGNPISEASGGWCEIELNKECKIITLIVMKAELAKKWLGKLTKLNAATGSGKCRGKAPHKPLLLLCLLDMAEAGELAGHTFTRTAGLVLRFKSYGALVSERWPTRLDMRMPFFYLRTQGFWQAFTMEMATAQSPESCFVCELHEEFFDLLADADFRLKARLLLVSRYFEPRERVALLASFGMIAPHPASGHLLPRAEKGYSLADAEMVGAKLNKEAEEAARKKGRSARFAVQVVSRYKFTCALTGLSCLTADGAAIVDAAHIEPFAENQNDDIDNGLALCKNAHWMFDEGLWAVRDDGRVILAPQRFTENGPEGLRLQPYAGRLLQFAASVTLRPNPKYFGQHQMFHQL
jgi:putative restriction endonuclease